MLCLTAPQSLERIEQYTTIEQEPKPTESGQPPAYWPASGSLVVERLSAKYSEDGPEVLHDIAFEAKAGERIGIGACTVMVHSPMLNFNTA